jgi:hypothetical protein
LEAGDIKVGEKYSINGDKTGIVFGEIIEIWRDEKKVDGAKQRDVISIKVLEKVRPNDKFFVLKNKNE